MSPKFSHSKIAILILAAGSSSRMGSPKQLLKWGNTTLLNDSITQAANSISDSVFVVLGANYSKVKDSIKNKSVTILINNKWELGLGNSIAYGLNAIQKHNFDGVLLMLADQPQVDTVFLNKLISAFEKGDKSVIATTYKNEGGVPAIFDKSYFNQLASLKGDKGAKLVINKSLADTTLITPSIPITDIDTDEMYEKAKTMLSPN